MTEPTFTWDLPPYAALIPEPLRAALWDAAEPGPLPGLRLAAGLRARHPKILTDPALGLLVDVYRACRGPLAEILAQRAADRAFIDATTRALRPRNAGLAIEDPAYATVIGAQDPTGQIVVGPLPDPPTLDPVAVPASLRAPLVTLFGPPDTAPMAINAMNAWHRRRPAEPPEATRLIDEGAHTLAWGADDEDSKTPIMDDFLAACAHLQGCFDGELSHDDPARGRRYTLAADHLAQPIKRFPGLALPDGSHLLDGQPLPLHLVDYALHCWHNRARPAARIFYAPKLETEAEAAYLRTLIAVTDAAIRARDPDADPAPARILVVFENPRAMFRIREIAAALGPHFLGGSLGWHDLLASTARLFREDPGYRIPVKADPNIVIERVGESHRLLVRALGPSGALKIGGMYGVLFDETDPRSYTLALAGYIRDVTTQLKRGLDGFWVAHPDFVRPGLALVEAWRRHTAGDSAALSALITALIDDPAERAPLLTFVLGPDLPPLDPADPRHPRSVLAADLGVSPRIANHDPEEIRYNLFQALQYLADWLSGNGCVALPATLTGQAGPPVSVRIMDDLATTERSRWEIWAELNHGRFPRAAFDALLTEELAFIRAFDDAADARARAEGGRRVQIRWRGEAARWYPIAGRLLHQLCTAADPPEWVSELTLPFTFPLIRDAADPWAAACALCPGKYTAP